MPTLDEILAAQEQAGNASSKPNITLDALLEAQKNAGRHDARSAAGNLWRQTVMKSPLGAPMALATGSLNSSKDLAVGDPLTAMNPLLNGVMANFGDDAISALIGTGRKVAGAGAPLLDLINEESDLLETAQDEIASENPLLSAVMNLEGMLLGAPMKGAELGLKATAKLPSWISAGVVGAGEGAVDAFSEGADPKLGAGIGAVGGVVADKGLIPAFGWTARQLGKASDNALQSRLGERIIKDLSDTTTPFGQSRTVDDLIAEHSNMGENSMVADLHEYLRADVAGAAADQFTDPSLRGSLYSTLTSRADQQTLTEVTELRDIIGHPKAPWETAESIAKARAANSEQYTKVMEAADTAGMYNQDPNEVLDRMEDLILPRGGGSTDELAIINKLAAELAAQTNGKVKIVDGVVEVVGGGELTPSGILGIKKTLEDSISDTFVLGSGGKMTVRRSLIQVKDAMDDMLMGIDGYADVKAVYATQVERAAARELGENFDSFKATGNEDDLRHLYAKMNEDAKIDFVDGVIHKLNQTLMAKDPTASLRSFVKNTGLQAKLDEVLPDGAVDKLLDAAERSLVKDETNKSLLGSLMTAVNRTANAPMINARAADTGIAGTSILFGNFGGAFLGSLKRLANAGDTQFNNALLELATKHGPELDDALRIMDQRFKDKMAAGMNTTEGRTGMVLGGAVAGGGAAEAMQPYSPEASLWDKLTREQRQKQMTHY